MKSQTALLHKVHFILLCMLLTASCLGCLTQICCAVSRLIVTLRYLLIILASKGASGFCFVFTMQVEFTY